MIFFTFFLSLSKQNKNLFLEKKLSLRLRTLSRSSPAAPAAPGASGPSLPLPGQCEFPCRRGAAPAGRGSRSSCQRRRRRRRRRRQRRRPERQKHERRRREPQRSVPKLSSNGQFPRCRSSRTSDEEREIESGFFPLSLWPPRPAVAACVQKKWVNVFLAFHFSILDFACVCLCHARYLVCVLS